MTLDDSIRHGQGGPTPEGPGPVTPDDDLGEPTPGERAAGWIDPEETAPLGDVDPEDTAPLDDVDPEAPSALPDDVPAEDDDETVAEDVVPSASTDDDFDTGVSEPTD